MSGEKRRFVIKPFRPHCQMDEAQALSIWSSLRGAIAEIYNKNASVLSFEELYRNAYNLVLHKHGDLLYEGVRETIRERLKSLTGDLCQRWEEHQMTMEMIRDILMYMDRTYVPQTKKLKVYDLGLVEFREATTGARKALSASLLEAVRLEREGGQVKSLKTALHMLTDLGAVDGTPVYEHDFETPFLEETRLFYRREASELLGELSCPEYVRRVEVRLKEEASRDLPSPTLPKLLRLVEQELIENHSKHLIEGFDALLTQGKLEDLRRMRLLFPFDLTEALNAHIARVGQDLLAEPCEPSEFLRKLLKMREKYTEISKFAFEEHKLDFAFINRDHRCAQSLVIYVDELMRQSRDIDLEEVMVIFRYLRDKDVFEALYKQALARRLLSKRSPLDYEKQLLAKFKSECGYQFTSKLEGMFSDVRASRDFTFEKLEVTLLTQGFWPISPTPPCNHPDVSAFETFYNSKFSGRKLAWQTSLGTAELRFKRHDLVVSTHQMCILLVFNDGCPHSADELSEITQVADLKRQLVSLCTPKHRILLKEGDVYSVNRDFTSKLKRVKIPLLTPKIQPHIPQTVEEDRRHLVEANIVRIMKARKSLQHNDLIAEVTRHLNQRFFPQPNFIKKCIESLLDREYIERDHSDARLYSYLA